MTRRIPDHMKKSPEQKQLVKEQKRSNKIASIKRELEGGHINSFEQVFTIMSASALANELNITYYIFRKKVYNPAEFTVGELMEFSTLLNVPYNTISNFI